MISYEEFENHILFLKEQNEYSKRLRSLYREFRDIVGDAEIPLDGSYFKQVELLDKLMGLEEDSAGYSTLLWWMEETEFGMDPKVPLMLEMVAPGEKFDFTSIRGLYDFLVREADWSFRERLTERLRECPVKVEETKSGFMITMDTDILEGLNRIALEDYNTTIENMIYRFFYWVESKPEEFKKWVNEIKLREESLSEGVE